MFPHTFPFILEVDRVALCCCPDERAGLQNMARLRHSLRSDQGTTSASRGGWRNSPGCMEFVPGLAFPVSVE